jgi:hypothetical protein
MTSPVSSGAKREGMTVKKSSRLTAGAALLCSGCAFHQVGLVHGSGATAMFDTPSDGAYTLILGEDAEPLGFLAGHDAEVWGDRVGHRVRVTDWKVGEGLHGMPTFVGAVEVQGAQVGMRDRNSKAYYVFDPEGVAVLRPLAGKTVLVEGYVDGAHRVRVLYYRILEPTTEGT